MIDSPSVSFFISFYDIDHSEQAKCIYFTQKLARCKNNCRKVDQSRAITLRERINSTSPEAVDLDLLREYILCNCCKSGRAQHQRKIESADLLRPLAQRWQYEIMRRTQNRDPTPAHEQAVFIPNAEVITTMPNPANVQDDDSEPRRFQNQRRYDLRSSHSYLDSISNQNLHSPLSEFHPHLVNPKRTDSVFHKMAVPLKSRDYQDGSLYIFDRESSPGYVKIGWTARSASIRLAEWQFNCDYRPNLLLSLTEVPHAQRVESLTHYELMKEWRREHRCRSLRCGKSHREWFEVDRERAKEVVTNWTKFMKQAVPYDSDGLLKVRWLAEIQRMDRDGEVVTAKRLLDCYEQSLAETAAARNTMRAGLIRIREQLQALESTRWRNDLRSTQEPTLSHVPTLLESVG